MATRRRHRAATPLPLMLLELSCASWETIARRSLMMARGTCSATEYARMVQEKSTALRQSATRLARSRKPPSPSHLLAPWHAKATSNARRLRRK